MKKMVFIEPQAPGFHIFSKFPIPRLGSFILATMMRDRGWEVEVVVEQLEGVDFDTLKGADLVGISTITPTAVGSYAIADRVRALGVPVIMGGPHVTHLPDEAMEHADFVIRGEGERALMAFVDAWEGDRDYSRVPNLSYRASDLTIHNPIQPFLENLDELPHPDLSLIKGGLRTISNLRIIPVQTSRGCPFDCSFCSVTGMFGKGYRYRSTENVIEELHQYDGGNDFVFFYDDNFTANRARARELLNAMIDAGFRFHWSTQVRVDVAKDEELVKLMKRAGCHTVFIGFESVNPASLKEMKKKQTVDDIAAAIRVIKRHGIHIHGMFVYGFDEDSPESVGATVRFTREVQLSSLQFLILTPLPGSDLYKKLNAENRILTTDWSLYDTHHVVFRPKNFTPWGLMNAQLYSHTKMYTWREMAKKLFQGNIIGLGLAYYARNLNIKWQKINRKYVKGLKKLSTGPELEKHAPGVAIPPGTVNEERTAAVL
ncbi:MAG: B12-binding domain-containing radical SAM protein [Spirochaetes bacterium]|nr:MAG: B12-binding domain-containing radical SAM protein [Spirochaetota bacterium]